MSSRGRLEAMAGAGKAWWSQSLLMRDVGAAACGLGGTGPRAHPTSHPHPTPLPNPPLPSGGPAELALSILEVLNARPGAPWSWTVRLRARVGSHLLLHPLTTVYQNPSCVSGPQGGILCQAGRL